MLALLAAPSLAASDDFGLLNRLLEAVTVPIPPIATEVGPATVEAWDIECSRLRVADVELRALPQPGAIRVSGAVRGLEVACTGASRQGGAQTHEKLDARSCGLRRILELVSL